MLNTHTGKFEKFNDPRTVKYAILSHVWAKEGLEPRQPPEQDHQDVIRIQKSSSTDNVLTDDNLSKKISEACKRAKEDGYDYLWIDTCCIDKTSSAEISETLNAMFRYYSVAQVCYVLLVETFTCHPRQLKRYLCDPAEWKKETFSVDTWHSRGWTLQELIAPRNVHFLSHEWGFIGSKSDLADGLERITGVPAGVLRFELQLDDISIAQRMSWASRRLTTRPEDEAYCLMGIFGVSMPTLYGEGRKAFRRLQEEIMRRSPDTTLYAWGACCNMHDLSHHTNGEAGTGLLANSPSDFKTCSTIQYTPSADGVSIHRSGTQRVSS